MIPFVSRLPRPLTNPPNPPIMKISFGLLPLIGCILAIHANAQNTITYLDLADTSLQENVIENGNFHADELQGISDTGNLDAFLSIISTPTGQTFDTSASGLMIYNMDAVRDNALLLDENRNSADVSHRSDLILCPDLLAFACAQQGDFTYSEAKMGEVGIGDAPQYPTLTSPNDSDAFADLHLDTSLPALGSIP